jgi:hypothetical protein
MTNEQHSQPQPSVTYSHRPQPEIGVFTFLRIGGSDDSDQDRSTRPRTDGQDKLTSTVRRYCSLQGKNASPPSEAKADVVILRG